VRAFPGVRVSMAGWVAGLDREVEFKAASEPVAETGIPVGTDLCRGEATVTEFRKLRITVQTKGGGESVVRTIRLPVADPLIVGRRRRWGSLSPGLLVGLYGSCAPCCMSTGL
jgi:hypothetical protein